jgi:hypothetical protein
MSFTHSLFVLSLLSRDFRGKRLCSSFLLEMRECDQGKNGKSWLLSSPLKREPRFMVRSEDYWMKETRTEPLPTPFWRVDVCCPPITSYKKAPRKDFSSSEGLK